MKRSAAEAFAAPPLAVPAFQPNGAALFDPKAYFAQLQQASATSAASQAASAPSGASAASAASASTQTPEVLQQVRDASAVKCAGIVKEKGQNFTVAVQIEAMHTMALKSSFKLREELVKHAHVRRLAQKVLELCRKPPPGLALQHLAKATWSLARFPDETRGDGGELLGATARLLNSTPPHVWEAETAVQILWSLARTDAIIPHKHLASTVVKELVKDKGLRVNQLSHEGMINLLFAIGRARVHDRKGDHRTVRLEANDEILFDLIGQRIIAEIEQFDIKLIADVIHTHAEVGLRREPLFKALCPRLVRDQPELREDVMAKVIKAYTRFMIPLKEEAQGFRTMAVVAKGDFQRPSEKPKRTGKVEFDKPQALFPKPQVHARF